MKPKYVQFWESVHISLFVIFVLSLLWVTSDEKSKGFLSWINCERKLDPDLLDYFETLDFCWKTTCKHEWLLRIGEQFGEHLSEHFSGKCSLRGEPYYKTESLWTTFITWMDMHEHPIIKHLNSSKSLK